MATRKLLGAVGVLVLVLGAMTPAQAVTTTRHGQAGYLTPDTSAGVLVNQEGQQRLDTEIGFEGPTPFGTAGIDYEGQVHPPPCVGVGCTTGTYTQDHPQSATFAFTDRGETLDRHFVGGDLTGVFKVRTEWSGIGPVTETTFPSGTGGTCTERRGLLPHTCG